MRHHRKVIRRLRARLEAAGYSRIVVRLRRVILTGWSCVVYRGVAMTVHGHAIERRRVDAIRRAFRGGVVR